MGFAADITCTGISEAYPCLVETMALYSEYVAFCAHCIDVDAYFCVSGLRCEHIWEADPRHSTQTGPFTFATIRSRVSSSIEDLGRLGQPPLVATQSLCRPPAERSEVLGNVSHGT